MSTPIRQRQHAAQPSFAPQPATQQPATTTKANAPKPAATNEPQQPKAASFSTFKQDAAKTKTTSKQDPARTRLDPKKARQQKAQTLADKLIDLAGPSNTLGSAALAKLSGVMTALSKSGLFDKSAMQSVQSFIKMAQNPGAREALIKQMASNPSITKFGNIIGTVIGVASVVNQVQKGNYVNALKEAYATAAGLTFGAPQVLYNATLAAIRIAYPPFKGSAADKLLSALDIIEAGKTGVAVIAECCKQLHNLCKYGKIDMDSIKRLAAQFKRGGSALFAEIGGRIGEKMYDVMDDLGRDFASLWLTLRDPYARVTPSQSGKISAIMGKLSEQMNSKDPTIRARASQMAKETLQSLLKKAKTDPLCKQGLRQWYGYVRSTGSQGFGKYKPLLKQNPKQMQDIHTQWRQSSNWLMRLFLSKTAPQV